MPRGARQFGRRANEREARAQLVECPGASEGLSEEEKAAAVRRTMRGTVVAALLATGIIALLVTGIIAYWPSSDRLRANNSASPPTAFEVARDAEPQSRN